MKSKDLHTDFVELCSSTLVCGMKFEEKWVGKVDATMEGPLRWCHRCL